MPEAVAPAQPDQLTRETQMIDHLFAARLEARPIEQQVLVKAEIIRPLLVLQKFLPHEQHWNARRGETEADRDTGTAAGFSMMPPGSICGPPIRLEALSGRGRVWRLTMFKFSTSTLRSRGIASTTRPSLPRSLPASMCTVSPLRIFIATVMS